MARELTEGKKIRWNTFVQGTDKFYWRYLGFMILEFLISIALLAVLLLILGGIVAGIAFVNKIVAIILGILFFLCLLLFFIAIAPGFVFAPVIMAKEITGPWQALKKGFGMLTRRFWPMVGAYLLIVLASIVVSMALFIVILPFSFAKIFAPESSLVIVILTMVQNALSTFIGYAMSMVSLIFFFRILGELVPVKKAVLVKRSKS